MPREYLMMDERAMLNFDDAVVLESCRGEWDAYQAVKTWAPSNGVLFAVDSDGPRMVGFAPDLVEVRSVGRFKRICRAAFGDGTES